MRPLRLPSACLLLLALPSSSSHPHDYTPHVDPLLGTEGALPGSSLGGGNVFPGPALPFGSVKLGLDTSVLDLPQGGISSANAGFTPRGNATGFSLLHVSGTGGQPKYGVVHQMPLLGALGEGVNVADNRTYMTNRTNEDAKVGYFTTTFETTAIRTELTATHHTGLLRYTFPPSPSPPSPPVLNTTSSSSASTSTDGTPHDSVTGLNTTARAQAHILVDLAHALPSGGGGYIAQRYVRGELHIAANRSGYSGSAWYDLGWNQGEAWQIHFCATFSRPPTSASTFWTPYNHLAPPPPPALNPYYDVKAGDNLAIGAVFTWEYEYTSTQGEEGEDGGKGGLEVESRVGVSFVSVEKACAFLQTEAPWSTSFNDTVQKARDAWNTEVLSAITVPKENGPQNETLLGLLYTHLYGSALMPTDRTGDNPGWASNEPYYDDWYTMWDIFRCTTPFFHLVYTNRYVDMLRSVVDIWRHEGFMPDGRSANYNGRTQGGSNADNVLADAYIKGLDTVKSINWGDAYRAVVTDAEVVPVHNIDFNAPDGGTKEGRNALPDWTSLGYITPKFTRSISKGIEYAQNDFAAHVLARGLGKAADARKYLGRAGNWKNFWNANASVDLGARGLGVHTGFFGSKNAEGVFDASVNVTNCGGCSWADLTYEGLIWEYSFNVPHDTAAVIKAMGGDAAFERRLDASWIQGFSAGSGAANTAGTALFNPGNEPSFQTPFLYNYIKGKQYKTVDTTRDIVDTYYTLKRSGIPGNQDAGAMATWLLWNLIGLYPVSSQPIYLVSAPFFKALDIRLGTADPTKPASSSTTYLKIRAPKLSRVNKYVQSLKVNGKSVKRSFIYHNEIIRGGLVEFTMGPKPSAWDEEVPPSLSTGNLLKTS